MANHTNLDSIPLPRRNPHVNLLTQFSVKKDILDIKLEDGPLLDRSNCRKSLDSGHMGNRSKSSIIIMTVLLLKATRHKMSLIKLK